MLTVTMQLFAFSLTCIVLPFVRSVYISELLDLGGRRGNRLCLLVSV